MIAYFLILAIPTTLSLYRLLSKDNTELLENKYCFLVVLVFLSLIIGLRDGVGGDWAAYLHRIEYLSQTDVAYSITWAPLYDLLNLISVELGGGIYLVNTFCALALVYGALKFCSLLRFPSLGLAVASPYFLVICGMGYTRQATAIGMIMLSVVYAKEERNLRALVVLVMAALMHRACWLFVPAFLLLRVGNEQGLERTLGLIGIVTSALIAIYHFNDLQNAHLVEGAISQGALLRGGLNILAAIAFVSFFEYEKKAGAALMTLRATVLCIMLTSFALLLQPKSVILDRLGLFFTPFQIYVFGTLPVLGKWDPYKERLATITVLVVCWSYLVIWIEFAQHAQFWLPYRNLLIH